VVIKESTENITSSSMIFPACSPLRFIRIRNLILS